MPTVHSVTFEKNRFNGLWRGFCSCGWFLVDDEEIVKRRAAVHDQEWVPVEAEATAPDRATSAEAV
jgi:hypothetical protein